MVDFAKECLTRDDAKRHREVAALRGEILRFISKEREQASRTFYHFGKLPLEIAIAIFSLVLTEDHAQIIILSHVCRNWRTTSLSTPKLWSVLVLSNKAPVRKVKTWKERSKGQLVELCLRSSITDVPQVLDELGDISWHSLRILKTAALSLHELRAHLPALHNGVVRNLGSLEIHDVPDSSLKSRPWSEPDMQLRTLSVHHAYMDWAAIARDCKRLEHFSFIGAVMNTPLSDIILLLRENPSLQKLVLHLLDYPDQRRPFGDAAITHINLPNLTHLELGTHDWAMCNILPILTVPILRTLHISRGKSSLDVSLRHLLRNGATSSLTELRITRCAVSAQSMIEFLHATRGLEILQLSHTGNNQMNIVLEALADPACFFSESRAHEQGPETYDSRGILCPALRHVDFSHCPDIGSGPLVRLVKTRLAASIPDVVPDTANEDGTTRVSIVQRIKVLVVDGCPSVDPDILPWLRAKVPTVSCVYMTKKDASWRR